LATSWPRPCWAVCPAWHTGTASGPASDKTSARPFQGPKTTAMICAFKPSSQGKRRLTTLHMDTNLRHLQKRHPPLRLRLRPRLQVLHPRLQHGADTGLLRLSPQVRRLLPARPRSHHLPVTARRLPRAMALRVPPARDMGPPQQPATAAVIHSHQAPELPRAHPHLPLPRGAAPQPVVPRGPLLRQGLLHPPQLLLLSQARHRQGLAHLLFLAREVVARLVVLRPALHRQGLPPPRGAVPQLDPRIKRALHRQELVLRPRLVLPKPALHRQGLARRLLLAQRVAVLRRALHRPEPVPLPLPAKDHRPRASPPRPPQLAALHLRCPDHPPQDPPQGAQLQSPRPPAPR
jgi:hypothetical protein